MESFSVSPQIPGDDNASYSVALSLFAAAAVLAILLAATMTLTMTRLFAMGICNLWRPESRILLVVNS